MKRKKKTGQANGSALWQGCHLSAHHALRDKFYEKAAKTLDDPELDREIAKAVIPILEKILAKLRAEVGQVPT